MYDINMLDWAVVWLYLNPINNAETLNIIIDERIFSLMHRHIFSLQYHNILIYYSDIVLQNSFKAT